jgi:hypothetical protein
MLSRISPVKPNLKPEKKLDWNGWSVALSYLGELEYNGLFIIDLSHLQKWNVQSHDPDGMQLNGVSIPARPRDVSLENTLMAVRLTPTEAFMMNLEHNAVTFESAEMTDITESLAVFALVGPHCLETLEKVSSVDLSAPGRPAPCAAQAPVEGLTSLLVYLKNGDEVPCLIVAVSRGYGQALYDILVDAGKEYGVSEAGWKRFEKWCSA